MVIAQKQAQIEDYKREVVIMKDEIRRLGDVDLQNKKLTVELESLSKDIENHKRRI